MVTRELLCVECGYDLRGLPRSGTCPECGSPIKRSFAGPLLRHAGTRWLKRVYIGLWILHRASVLAALLAIATPALDLFGYMQGGNRSMRAFAEAMSLIFTAWAFAAMTGFWLATAPDVRESGRTSLQNAAERLVLMAIPPITLAWVALGVAYFGIFGWSTATLNPVVRAAVFIALFTVTWWQGRTLARWLNRIDARVDPAVRAQPTIIDTINETVASVSRAGSRSLTAADWRWMTTWSPLVFIFIAWAWWRTGSIHWWMLAFSAVLPAMTLLSMRRTVRDVGMERSIGLELHGTPASEPNH